MDATLRHNGVVACCGGRAPPATPTPTSVKDANRPPETSSCSAPPPYSYPYILIDSSCQREALVLVAGLRKFLLLLCHVHTYMSPPSAAKASRGSPSRTFGLRIRNRLTQPRVPRALELGHAEAAPFERVLCSKPSRLVSDMTRTLCSTRWPVASQLKVPPV